MAERIKPLIEVFGELEDVRQARGKRYSLAAMLSLAVVAMLCGYSSYSAMARFGVDYGSEWAERLGFKRGRTPCVATWHHVFRRLKVSQFEAKLGAWADSVLRACPAQEGEAEALSVDGKTLRESARRGASGVHLVAAVSQRLGLTLCQQASAGKGYEQAQLQQVLAALVLQGRVITVDALHTHRSVAQAILTAGGDYVMLVKDNQKGVQEDIRTLFAEPRVVKDTLTTASTLDVAHGRIEHRHLTASTALQDYTDWPGLQQVFQLVRHITDKKTGHQRREVVYGLTSLSPTQADAARLLELVRGHWLIENQLHYVRDVTFQEDRSPVRCGHIPHVMAALRNTVIGLMRLAGHANIPAAAHAFAARPQLALRLIASPPDF